MGTDIHFQIHHQVKNDNDGNEPEWVFSGVDDDEEYDSEFYIGRDYLLFAVLAGVRNRYGTKNNPLKPIAPLRGLPPELIEDGDDCLLYGVHSQSWLLSTEILEYFKSNVISRNTGIISMCQYMEWDKISPLYRYSGNVFGEGVVILDATEKLLSSYETETDNAYVRVSWEMDVSDELDYFIKIIEKLQKEHGIVRMVFGFDS